MKYSYLRQLTLDKMFLTLEEARNMNYLEKIPRAFNEALNLISGALSPNCLGYKFKLRKIDLWNNRERGLRVEMPFNFSSFSQINDCYLDGQPFILENYLGANSVTLYGTEVPGYNVFDNYLKETETVDYELWYNAFYPQISTQEVDGSYKISITDIEFFPDDIIFVDGRKGFAPKTVSMDNYEFDERVAFLLPYYAASQCLMQDDRVLAMQYKNEFELYLARIDIENFQRPRQYRSSKGLY